MSKVWFLIVLAYGEVVESPPNPMTAKECATAAADWVVKAEQLVVNGELDKYGGNEVTLNDVEVKCLRRRK